MAVINNVSNSECLLMCKDYDLVVDTAIDSFASNIDIANIEDTLVIHCDQEACALALEKYIKIVRGAKEVRNGISDTPCALRINDK